MSARQDLPPVGPHASNCFDLLRIAAALMVLVSHQFALTGRDEFAIDHWQSVGGVGLLVFFTMSGYLVTASWMRDPNVWRFGARRLLRLWPALAVVVVLTAFVVGPVVTTLPPGAYFGDPDVLRYIGMLWFDHVDRLPGLFEHNPYRGAVNGSLGTLPIEVRWYEYLALAGVLGIVRRRWLLVVVTAGLAFHYFVIFDVQRAMTIGVGRHWKEELGLYFLAGACLQRFSPAWIGTRRCLFAVAAALGIVFFAVGAHHAAYWIWVSTATILAALSPPGALAVLTRRGDLSYGVYLYAFPVQQTFIAFGIGSLPFAWGLACVTATTIFLAWLSWHWVEAPALGLKPRRSTTWDATRSSPARTWLHDTFAFA